MAWAPGMSLLSKWWPSNRRGFAAGFANGFAGFGQAVCMGVVIIIFAVIPQAGWRAAFFYPALIAVILSVLYAYGIKETPHAAGLPEYTDNVTSTASELKINASLRGKSKLYPYIYLIKEWKFDVWLLIIALSSIARYGLLNWIPLYFTNTMGMDIKDGLMENLLLSVGMGCGTLVIPALSDKLCRNDRLPAVLTCSVAGGLAVLLFMFSQTMWIIDILLFTAGFFLYAINGLVWPFAIDIGGRQLGWYSQWYSGFYSLFRRCHTSHCFRFIPRQRPLVHAVCRHYYSLRCHGGLIGRRSWKYKRCRTGRHRSRPKGIHNYITRSLFKEEFSCWIVLYYQKSKETYY